MTKKKKKKTKLKLEHTLSVAACILFRFMHTACRYHRQYFKTDGKIFLRKKYLKDCNVVKYVVFWYIVMVM